MIRKVIRKPKKIRSPRPVARKRVKASARAKSAAKTSASSRRKRSAKNTAKKAEAAPRDSIDSLIAASAEALHLPVDPDWHAGIRFNLQLILKHAALVDEFLLSDEAEPAPVFHA